MSFQWIAIAGILYTEIVLVILFLLPFVSAKRWKMLFQSSLGQLFSNYANYYFNIFMVLLGICFVDAIREMRKYAYTDKAAVSMANQVSAVDHINMKLFRAQRNFYIAGFSLFLWFVLRRLVKLLLDEATQSEQFELAKIAETKLRKDQDEKDATIAGLTKTLDRFNQERMDGTPVDDHPLEQVDRREMGEPAAVNGDREEELLNELADANDRLMMRRREIVALQEQKELMSEELGRLNADYENLQVKYNILVEGEGGDYEAAPSHGWSDEEAKVEQN